MQLYLVILVADPNIFGKRQTFIGHKPQKHNMQNKNNTIIEKKNLYQKNKNKKQAKKEMFVMYECDNHI